MIKKLISSTLIILHVFTFGHINNALAVLAQSASYKLDTAAYSQGGLNRNSSSYKIAQDLIGQACQGISASAGYKLTAGYIYTVQSNPPESATIPNQSWNENESKSNALDLDDYFTSPDGLSLIYTVTGNTNISVTIDPITHQVSFSQPQAWNGTETVRFTAADTENNSTQSNPVSLQVQGVENPPVLDFVPDITVNENDLVKITPNATDLDADPITYSFIAPLNANGQWQTDYISAGTYTTTVTASDPTGLKDTQDVKIVVRNVNRLPVISAINGIPVTAGQPVVIPGINEEAVLQITPAASDPDNETVNFYYSAPLDSTGKWITDYDDAGICTATVTASDSIDTVTQQVRITVLNVNRPPVFTLVLSKYTVGPNETFSVTLSASDPDDNTMTYSLKKDGVEFSSGPISTPGMSAVTSFSSIGDHTISAVVTDAGGLQCSDQAAVDVYDPSPNVNAINPVMGDFNGDSLSDLGLHNSDTGTWEICLSEAGAFNASIDWLTGFGASRDWWPVGGDFNGDGRTDIGIYNNTTGELKIALSDGAKFNISGTWLTFSGASYSWIPVTGNFNGDKFTDFGLYNKDTGEWKVAKGTGSGFSEFTTWLMSFGSADHTPLTGDFNADGLTDICIFKKSAGEFKVAFSNTKAFIPNQNPWITNYAVDKDPIISDFNSDGLTDVGYFDKSRGKWFQALNTTSAFTDSGVWLEGFGFSSDESGHTGDFNGDGITDAAAFDRDQLGINRWAVKLVNKKPQDLLVEVDNGIGGKTQITYQYASTYNNELLPFPVYVTSRVSSINTQPIDRAATYTQDLTYEGGWFDATEREFRGFSKIKITDPITGNYTETYFYQGKPSQDGALKGQIEKVLAYDGNGKLISQAINTWEVRKAGPTDGALGFPYLKEVTQTVYEENQSPISTKNQFSYDNLGNIINETCQGDVAQTGDEKSTATKYSLAYEQGHNRPMEVALNDKDGNLVNQKTFEYDANGNLTRETAYLDGVNDPTTQYGYDSFGNVTSTTNAEGHTVLTCYESIFYAFPETITNELGHTIKYEYNTRFGVVTKLTDVNNQTTETVYDSLARIIQQKNTQGQVVTAYRYPDFNTKITTQLGMDKTEYSDGLGRPYRTVSDGEDGTSKRQVSAEIYFNERGLKDRESLPHYIDEDIANISYIAYTYDLRGRIKTTTSDFPGVIKDAASVINYINPLYMETIDPRGTKKGVKKDVYGNTIEITEFTQAGTYKTLYEYDLKGNLTKLTDSQGNITQIQYDRLGRKVSLNDPDTGVTAYTYNKLGNLLTQTDNKGNVITMEYDVLSRLIAKRGLPVPPQAGSPITLATYEYDDTSKPNCLGRLSRVEVTDTSRQGQTTSVSVTSYYYDSEGRAIKVDKTIDGTPYTTQTAYDLIGRTVSITYPDGEVVNYAYDPNSGLLEKVSSSVDYVKSINYNAKGQILATQYGNNTQTNYTYGQDLRLSRILTSNSSSALQDLNYDFDKDGNITTLTDNLRSNIRSYIYDDLNRLTRAENTPDPNGGYTVFNYQYDSIGNMTYKSDVGFMSYGEKKGLSPQGTVPITAPHAVTTASSNNYTYDANGNMLSAPNKLMMYDVENRMTALETPAGTTQFIYDESGNRIKKISSNETVTYVSSLYEMRNANGVVEAIKYIFAGSNRVCTVSSTNTVNYFHADHLGSSNIITDQSGSQVSLCEYTPYGTIALDQGSFSTPYKFTGKELDATGLYFYAWRYYDPTIGRFCQPDTIIPEPYNPQTLNRYSYCDNNPLNYTDPTGHWSWKKFFNSAVGALVGGIVAGILTGGFGFTYAAAGFWGGMAGGAVTGALDGGARGALLGGALGGTLGALGGWGISKFGAGFAVAMGVAGVGATAATDSWDSLAGGILGGTIGYYAGNSIGTAWHNQSNKGFASSADEQIEKLNLRGDLSSSTDAQRKLAYAESTRTKAYWPKWTEVFVPGYGNYMGPMRTDLSFSTKPIDSLDRLGMNHDFEWFQGQGACADKTILKNLHSLPSDPSKWAEPPQSARQANFYRRCVYEPFFWWRNLLLKDQ